MTTTDRLTLAAAAEIAGVVPSTLRHAIHRGTLRATREGPPGPRGLWYVERADLDAYLSARPAGTVERWRLERARSDVQ